MTAYRTLTIDEQERELTRIRALHNDLVNQNFKLDMTRGKPSPDQLELSLPMLDAVNSNTSCEDEGIDCRNYGCIEGIPSARALMAHIADDVPENVIIYGSSSLNAMYDTIARCKNFGTGGHRPWRELPVVKWLCPSPGYDRHFAVCEAFGIEMVPVAMGDDGPDMDEIERLAREDDAVKGIWCVPQYSNPTGITYSDEVVERLASMEAAEDFRIFWDNAYAIHHLYDDPALQDHVADIGAACRKAGHPDRYIKFVSTSKVTFPGAGVAAIVASPTNCHEVKAAMSYQTIGPDKLNQLRHARFLPDAKTLADHMSAQAAIMRPKFERLLNGLDEGLTPLGVGSWSHPRGGYFVNYHGEPGTARRIGELAAQAGVALTKVGSSWPYGYDPNDADLRLAPTFLSLEEVGQATDVFVVCAALATLEMLLASNKIA